MIRVTLFHDCDRTDFNRHKFINCGHLIKYPGNFLLFFDMFLLLILITNLDLLSLQWVQGNKKTERSIFIRVTSSFFENGNL